jgi:hypothetical protein
LKFYAQRFTEPALVLMGVEDGMIAGWRFLLALWFAEAEKFEESG